VRQELDFVLLLSTTDLNREPSRDVRVRVLLPLYPAVMVCPRDTSHIAPSKAFNFLSWGASHRSSSGVLFSGRTSRGKIYEQEEPITD
jgi:hypothetical protein